MSISSLSFWQQNQNFWARAAQRSQSLASSAALMSVMSDAITNQVRGMASIANQTALDRTNTALSAALQSALQGANGTSANSSSANSSGAASTASGTSTASGSPSDTGAISGPATGKGTVPLTSSTALQTFHIIKGGTFSVSDGIGSTVYTSSGHDTVGDVINAINNASPGHAQAFAWVDGNGKLNVAATDTSHTITIGGTAAAPLGFGAGNTSFQPATNTTSTSTSAPSGTSAAGSSSQSSTTAKSASPSPKPFAQNSSPALLTGGTAEILLASNGSAGFLVNLLA
jgi:hypothetical protein